MSEVMSVDSFQDLTLVEEERFQPVLQTLYSAEITDDQVKVGGGLPF